MVNYVGKTTNFGINNYRFSCKIVIKSLLIINLWWKFSQKYPSEKELLLNKAFKKYVNNENKKVYFSQFKNKSKIKSNSIRYNLKTSGKTQKNLAPNFYKI